MRATTSGALALAFLLGCGGSKATPDGGAQVDAPATGDATPIAQLTFSITSLDDADAGYEPEIVLGPNGRLAIAYYRAAASEGTCTRIVTDGGPAGIEQWDVVYAAEQADGSFVKEIAATTTLLTLEGLSLAFDGNGNPAIAFMGGTEGAYRCGGTDTMLAQRSAAGTWTTATVDTTGAWQPALAQDVQCCATYQNICTSGDVVGPWPALAFCGGDTLVAYRNVHFGFAQDDFAKADVEFARGNGSYSITNIDASCGGGTYTRMLTDDGCQPHIAHYNQFINQCDGCGRHSSGIWVNWNDGSAWQRQNVVPDIAVGYKLGFARAGSRYGLTYYPPKQSKPSVEQKLWFVNSADGVTWDAPEIVDQTGDTGRSPSLAFDPAGRPAIAYYMCRNQYDPSSTDCDSGKDGLKFAVKEGVWTSKLVKNAPGTYDGLYVSLAYDAGGMPVIVYQSSAFDPSTSTSVNSLVVARGQVQ